MEKVSFYADSLFQLNKDVDYVKDKPMETPESTLKILWYFSKGEKLRLEDVSGISMEELPVLTRKEEDVLEGFIQKRKRNIPLAYILGYQSFMGVDFLVDKRALIPRIETEILAHTAIKLLSTKMHIEERFRVIDVCCGCGNVGLSIAKEYCNADVFLSDITEDAVLLARENTDFLGLSDQVKIYQGDFLERFENDEFYNKVDLIVCNPPYIPSSRVSKMHNEISLNEPKEAFDGGMMGIKIIQRLISESAKFLNKEGWVAFEIGLGQGDFVLKFAERSGNFTEVYSANDEEGNVRVVYAKK